VYVIPIEVLDAMMYQTPVDGRNTATSILPSPS